MPLLIDGHNLIGHVPGISLADADDEAQLVLLLRRYATRKRGRRVVVVFDGGVYGHPHSLNGYGVECHFAKSPYDADRELIRRIRAIRRRGEWQVVTSDRAVAGEARAHNIPVITAQRFVRTLQQTSEPTPQVADKQRERPLSKQEIEDWLRLFGVSEEDDDDPDQQR